MKSNKGSVLYIAYHYPPVLGSSGVHRTLAFTRHLLDHDWRVRVLTVSLKAYQRWSEEQLSFIPQQVEVIRAYARNVAKHFTIKGKYWSGMALPDNWQSWIIGGVLSGLKAIVKERPTVLVSTYPIASAHLIGYILHKITGIPWVADLRDPMAQDDYPKDRKAKKIFQWLEKKIVNHCAAAIVTTPGAKQLYVDRYPDTKEGFWHIVPNGYDAKLFDELADKPEQGTAPPPSNSHKAIVLHSGIIYPYERDPSQFFQALAELKASNQISADVLEVRLRASGHEQQFSTQVTALGIDDIVVFAPTIPYQQALDEMMSVDGLLILQAANCNYQIPAKAYEYIRVQKPVLALTPTEGDTGQLLAEAGNSYIAPLDDKDAIKTAILDVVAAIQQQSFAPMTTAKLASYSRQQQAHHFEEILRNVHALAQCPVET